jgi:hypothetical protein
MSMTQTDKLLAYYILLWSKHIMSPRPLPEGKIPKWKEIHLACKSYTMHTSNMGADDSNMGNFVNVQVLPLQI